MNEYLSQVNAGAFYLIIALVLTFITVMCLVFLVKSYRAGIKIGMDKKNTEKDHFIQRHLHAASVHQHFAWRCSTQRNLGRAIFLAASFGYRCFAV